MRFSRLYKDEHAAQISAVGVGRDCQAFVVTYTKKDTITRLKQSDDGVKAGAREARQLERLR
jgi:hypothetical protein